MGAALAAASAVLAVSSPARAEPTGPEKALATTLFNEAKALLADERIPEACRKLEESRRLDPLPGTILNLAVCHEKEGLLASAFAEFREARALAERDRRDDRVALADEHLAAIAPRISQLVVVVEPSAEHAELRITCDATVLGRPAWGTRIPMDPGEHVIVASAPGKRASRSVVQIGRDADVQTVSIAALEDEPPAPALPAEPAAVPAPVPAPADAAAGGEAPSGLSTRRTIALATAGIGVVGLGLGSYFGLRAIDKHGDPAATCTTAPCSSESLSLNDDAKAAADAATVSFTIGLVALGAAAFLWFGDSPTRPTKTARALPTLGLGRAGVQGRF